MEIPLNYFSDECRATGFVEQTKLLPVIMVKDINPGCKLLIPFNKRHSGTTCLESRLAYSKSNNCQDVSVVEPALPTTIYIGSLTSS